jgi:hypothetical protein
MNSKNQWKLMVAGSAAAVMLTLGTAAVYPQVSQAADTTTVAPVQGQRGHEVGGNVDRDAQLAEALGVTTEELQAAYKTAANAALDQAVKDELLTQAQADTLRERMDAAGTNGFGHFGFERMGRFGDSTIDFEALLAAALKIDVKELQAAQVKAEQAELAQAVQDGDVTQEQADLMAAQRAFRVYQEEQQPTFEEQLKDAVTAGAITQAQADLLLANQKSAPAFGPGMMGPGMMGPGMMGPGMDGGRRGGPDMNGAPQGRPGMGGRHGRGGNSEMPFGNDGGQNGQQNQQPDFGAPQSDVAPTAPAAGL